MAIVVEQLNRGGHVISTQTFESSTVSVGRGLDNDFIIHDPHADACHLKFQQDPSTHNFYCADQETLNGAWLLHSPKPGRSVTLKNKRRLVGRNLFYSGQQFLIGRTVIRVFSSEHPVVAPLPLSRWEDVGVVLSQWWVWLVALLCIVSLQSYNGYLNNPTQDHIFQYILPSGYAIIGALVYAGLWAFIGRNLKHESRFATHLSLALLSILVTTVFGWLFPIIAYNGKIWWAYVAVDKLLASVVVFCIGLLTLLYATNLKPITRFLVALILPVAMLLSLLISAFTISNFRSSPQYETLLVVPKLQWRESVTSEQFFNETETLYAPTNKEVSVTATE